MSDGMCLQNRVSVGLYLCDTPKGKRVCRFGYHRKNNTNNYSLPLNWKEGFSSPVKLIWIGWRDDKTLDFYREVTNFSAIEKEGREL